MAKYTIELTDAEDKAMNHVAYSVQEWIENAVKNRANTAMEKIYNDEVERMNSDDSIKSIPANKNQGLGIELYLEGEGEIFSFRYIFSNVNLN